MNPVEKYFTGEKAESYVFLVIGVLAIALALYFFFVLKTSFWKGVAIPFMVVAILELMVGVTIVTRSPKDLVRVENFIKNEPQQIQTSEIPRMEVVMRNFVMYRYVEIGLIILGIGMMYASPLETFRQGLGLGIFIKASMVLCFDFFAESRGHVYLDYLTSFTDKL